MKKSGWCIAGNFAGIVTSVIGIVLLIKPFTLEEPLSLSFGADYYTYSYSGIRAVAVNIATMASFLKDALAVLLISIGFFAFCYFGLEMTKEHRAAEQLFAVKPSEQSLNGKRSESGEKTQPFSSLDSPPNPTGSEE